MPIRHHAADAEFPADRSHRDGSKSALSVKSHRREADTLASAVFYRSLCHFSGFSLSKGQSPNRDPLN